MIYSWKITTTGDKVEEIFCEKIQQRTFNIKKRFFKFKKRVILSSGNEMFVEKIELNATLRNEKKRRISSHQLAVNGKMKMGKKNKKFYSPCLVISKDSTFVKRSKSFYFFFLFNFSTFYKTFSFFYTLLDRKKGIAGFLF